MRSLLVIAALCLATAASAQVGQAVAPPPDSASDDSAPPEAESGEQYSVEEMSGPAARAPARKVGRKPRRKRAKPVKTSAKPEKISQPQKQVQPAAMPVPLTPVAPYNP